MTVVVRWQLEPVYVEEITGTFLSSTTMGITRTIDTTFVWCAIRPTLYRQRRLGMYNVFDNSEKPKH